MKYLIILTVLVWLTLVFLTTAIMGLISYEKSYDKDEIYKQIIFKLSADNAQCIAEREDYKFTVDSMAVNCN